MVVGGGCRELVALFPGPDLGIGCPPLADGPVGSNLLRSSLKASSFFDGLSTATKKTTSLSTTRSKFSTQSKHSATKFKAKGSFSKKRKKGRFSRMQMYIRYTITKRRKKRNPMLYENKVTYTPFRLPLKSDL